MNLAEVKFENYETSVSKALDMIGAAERLPRDRLIVVKPNLTNADPPPVTTPVKLIAAICRYCRSHTPAEIAIGEGCGSGVTADAYRANGYDALAAELGIHLIDFNTAPDILLRRDDAFYLKEFHLPEILREAFVISAPILKDHSFTVTTVAMKNMFGVAPAPYYRGSWNKSRLHSPSTHRSVVDVCRYKKPDLCVVDAVIALTGMHLAGTPRRLDVLLAGYDCVAVDAAASRLLGHDPRRIEYLRLADGRLGRIEE